ncbi:MAG: type II toxin-antitoxin system Phd/YefM family antitoxin [Pseudomonadota bacterium]
MAWQLAEAKNKFSEVVRRALTEGPQVVSRRGERVVVVSEAEWEKATGRDKKQSLGAYLLSGPSLEGLDLSRDRSEGRDVDLGE